MAVRRYEMKVFEHKKRNFVSPRGHVIRGTQREYSSKPHKHSIVERTLVFKQ